MNRRDFLRFAAFAVSALLAACRVRAPAPLTDQAADRSHYFVYTDGAAFEFTDGTPYEFSGG